MAVNTPSINISPYTPTVPLVQADPAQMDSETRPSQPLAGQFGRSGTGALAIGDSILKGFMLGHQMKEQRKAEQARATIAVADQATHDAYQQYQDALSSGKDEATTKAAYAHYLDVFNQGKEKKAQFIIPEKGTKSASGGKGAKGKGAGAMANIKDWFAANPQLVPQLAIATMQPQPPGMSPETQQAKMGTDEAQQRLAEGKLKLEIDQRKAAAEKVYVAGAAKYASLTSQEVAGLSPEAKQDYDKWVEAKAELTPIPNRYTGATKLYQTADGKLRWLHPEEASPDDQPVNLSGVLKPGTAGFALQKYAEKLGKRVEDLTFDEMQDAVRQEQTNKQVGTVTSTTTRPGIDSTTTTSIRRPLAAGGVAPPPQRTAAPTTVGSSGVTAPPARAGESQQPSLRRAQITMKVETEKRDRYAQAQKSYDSQVHQNRQALDGNKIDQAEFEKRNTIALGQLYAAQHGIEQWYNGQVHAIGGTVPSDNRRKAEPSPPPGATTVYRDPKTHEVAGWAVNGQYVPVTK